jgi:arylsulfatase
MNQEPDRRAFSRREFNRSSAGALVAPLVAAVAAGSEAPRESGSQRQKSGGSRQGLNILFIFTDQERYTAMWPTGLSLPGHERLQETGVTFTQHYTSACMCTPSRSVLLTGLQTADNKMFDNCDCPWQQSLSPEIPTIGDMLRKDRYYTAYKGKWHLNGTFDSHQPTKLFTKEMEEYTWADTSSTT